MTDPLHAGTVGPNPSELGTPLDVENLEIYLCSQFSDFRGLDHVTEIKGGASNPTYVLRERGFSGRNLVLRKKPTGQLLTSAHQVEREFKIMRALEPTNVPVPKVHMLCEDTTVIGTPFYVMDFLGGRIFRDAKLPDMAREERAAIYESLNDTLARIHKVDYASVGLAQFGRPGNYFHRQIARWTKQYRDAGLEPIPDMEKLIAYLPEHIPKDGSISIAHGDYRLENVMFHPTEPTVIAVLDWELSTIGHPIADVAFNCLLWHSMPDTWGNLRGVDFESSGIPNEVAYRDAYCRRTSRAEIPSWNFYLAFSLFRLASISQGVRRRVLEGTADSSRLAADGASMCADQAWRLISSTN